MEKRTMNHYVCKTIMITKTRGIETNNEFRFVSYDGVKHMENLKKSYMQHGVQFEYADLRQEE